MRSFVFQVQAPPSRQGLEPVLVPGRERQDVEAVRVRGQSDGPRQVPQRGGRGRASLPGHCQFEQVWKCLLFISLSLS